MQEMTKTQKKRFYLGIFFCVLGIVVLTLSYPTYYDVLAVPFGICITVGFYNALVAVLDPQEKKNKKIRERDVALSGRGRSCSYFLVQQHSVPQIRESQMARLIECPCTSKIVNSEVSMCCNDGTYWYPGSIQGIKNMI